RRASGGTGLCGQVHRADSPADAVTGGHRRLAGDIRRKFYRPSPAVRTRRVPRRGARSAPSGALRCGRQLDGRLYPPAFRGGETAPLAPPSTPPDRAEPTPAGLGIRFLNDSFKKFASQRTDLYGVEQESRQDI